MSEDTLIEWCDSTLNLMAGCDGCELWRNGKGNNVQLCYAGKLVERYRGVPGWPERFTKPVIYPDRINKAVKWSDLTGRLRQEKVWLDGMPRVVFLNDLGDTFTESLSIDWLVPYIPVMADSPHLWLILTKRANRMRDFWQMYGKVPENVWLGVSITSASNVARLKYLKEIEAPVRFVSIEPVLGPMPNLWAGIGDVGEPQWLDWAIVGGLSGSYNTSNPGWIADVVVQVEDRGIPLFFKQWGNIRANPNKQDPTAYENGGDVKGGRLVFGKELNGMPEVVRVWRAE